MSVSHSPSIDRTAATRRIGKLAYGMLFTVLLPLLLAFWATALDRRVELPDIGSHAAGLAIAFAGAILVVAAVAGLRVRGGGWPMSPFPPAHFVTTGAYALVAHPIYVGSILLTLGISMRTGNAAGVWIVTTVLCAACVAWVWGGEGDRTRAQFGARTSPPLLHLPRSSQERPVPAERISVYFLALLPWLLVYEGINQLATPPDAIGVASRWDALIPVIGWTEILYFAAYPLVLFAPLVARSARELRTFVIGAWVATAGSAVCYLTLPTIFEKKGVPPSTFAAMLEWERAFDAPNTALPAFHVIWPMIALRPYAVAFPRLRFLYWPVVMAIGVSCVTTGMHALIDVVAGVMLGLVFANAERVWRSLVRSSERVAASWKEWRVGPVRVLNHGVYAGAGVTLGVAMIVSLAGEAHRSAIVLVAAASIAGAALWAQLVEGSPSLLRPFGYYGGILGGVTAIGAASLWNRSGLIILAAYAVAAPFIQAAGRLRCLVQGCCHGRPVESAIGMRVTHPASRVVRIAGLSGVPLHPTALVSIVVNLVAGALLLRLWIAGAPLTFIAGAYLIVAGLTRFVEEHFRGEPQTRVIAGLRLYQWMSIASLVAGCVLTALPSPPAPAMEGMSLTTFAVALAAGLVASIAYGVDFPDSKRRFARLT
jgi:prolipoprotein diacylglyceryltransferase/protein-S-isoprenylcysteine O-methyltransferase Ste14